MSDTRAEAAQEMVEAGLQTGMEDTLGASLSGSFAPPPSAHPHHPATEVGTTQASGASAPEPEAESTPVPGMDDWKPTYDAYVKDWQHEADIAREKALKNRKFYEDEAEAKEKAKKDEEALKKRREREEKRAEEGRERLRRELAGEVKPAGGGVGRSKEKTKGEKVKEAWEMVKASEGKEAGEGKEVVADGRGVMPQDVRAGQAVNDGEARSKIQQTMYDPTTSTEPMPPSMKSSPPSGPSSNPTESQAASRHSATSQAWEEVSRPGTSSEDLSPSGSGSTSSAFDSATQFSNANLPKVSGNSGNSGTYGEPGQTDKVPHPLDAAKNRASSRSSLVPTSGGTASGPNGSGNGNGNGNAPPTQPPSLTLSLFTAPSNLSLTRVIAVLGINLVLPFINGVMLGFGEIFAREAVKVGGMIFRGERRFMGWGRGADDGQGRRRGVEGVGLSGSGGFP